MRMQHVIYLALCCSAASLSGCAMNRPASPLGGTVGLTLAQQIWDPAAGVNRPAVDGLDGQAAKSGYDTYQKSFRAPQPQPNVFTIGVGGSR